MTIAYIGMGGNLASAAGGPEATLAAARKRLQTLGQVVAQSHLYSTAPVGYADQPRFVNAVVGLRTALRPHELLDALMQVEREFGRERMAGLRNGPRTLDLDILLYGDVVLEETELTIPHPRLGERLFVLAPLAEMAPALREPRTGKTMARLLAELVASGGIGEQAAVTLPSDTWNL